MSDVTELEPNPIGQIVRCEGVNEYMAQGYESAVIHRKMGMQTAPADKDCNGNHARANCWMVPVIPPAGIPFSFCAADKLNERVK
jgi:hypothetical protein